MKLRERQGGSDIAAVNLTSMIDCVFLLLIFFVSTLKAPKLEANIQAYLPRTQTVAKGGSTTEKKAEEKNQVVVALRRGSSGQLEVLLNGALLEGGLQRLNGALAALRHVVKDAASAKTEIIIDAEPVVPYRHVVTTVDICAKHNFAAISFAMPAPEAGETP